MECAEDANFTTPRTIPRTENDVFTFVSPPTKSEPTPREPSKGRSMSRLSSSRSHKMCLYRTGKCSNQRHIKPNGSLHKMCTFHRAKANENQRRLDQKKKDAGFHRRERISAFKVKGVLQPKSATLVYALDSSDAPSTGTTQLQQVLSHPLEDIMPDVMIPFLLDSYLDVTGETTTNSSSSHVA
ncbi:hypothetical protein DYB37_011316 [Aphanomyces astaci]|uniref:Uncharacterized protein n=2 Tax=Aphanomyces astaci TaxID=112090 RepID=A0A418FH24_APHAT|nr:hypothetical protein DYB37_011316 [Aphanomyces astaci]